MRVIFLTVKGFSIAIDQAWMDPEQFKVYGIGQFSRQPVIIWENKLPYISSILKKTKHHTAYTPFCA